MTSELFYLFVTSLPIVAESVLVYINADEVIARKLLERNVIPCGSTNCKRNKHWDCVSEISRQSNYLGLTVALSLTFIIGALLATLEWHRAFMIIFGVGLLVCYLVNLFMKEEGAERPIVGLTKYTSRLLELGYLIIGVVTHYLFIAIF